MKTINHGPVTMQPATPNEGGQRNARGDQADRAAWIIYPAIAWVALTTTHARSVYMRRPISEREIEREIERQAGGPRDG
jgi:hypothetical protein